MDKQIEAANQRLKAANSRAKIQQRGRFLTLRGTFPDRKGPGQSRQRIPLGLSATPAGVKQAEKLARKLTSDLDLNQFDWGDWIETPSEKPLTAADQIAAFNVDYLQKGGGKGGLEDYQKIFRKIPSSQPLTPELLLEVVQGTTPGTRTREKAVRYTAALAKFAGLKGYDPFPYLGNYTPAPRDLPTDALILEQIEKFTSPQWRWAYLMLATYGLRPHEIFRLDGFRRIDGGFLAVRVGSETKTKDRETPPLYPEWADRFFLFNIKVPHLDLSRPNRALGGHVSKAFKRASVPFTPYDLRHAWAVRAIKHLIPLDLRAKMMGHSPEVHARIYQRWIRQEDLDGLCKILLTHPDRPRSPIP